MQLSRRRIITAAMDLIEADGVQAVDMTRLATELGCGLVALYSYVPSTSALLDGIAVALLARAEVTTQPGAGWPAQVQAQVRAVRRAARAYPRCAVAIAGRAPSAAAMLRPAENVLAALREAGFGGPDAARVVRVIAAYLAGSLLREAGVAPGAAEDAARWPQLRQAEFPNVAELAGELAGADPDADFEFGLSLLLGGTTRLLGPVSQPLPGSRGGPDAGRS